jgi:hypothetical protein
MSSPDLGNVPSQPVQGEVAEIEAQEQGAPLASRKADNLPLATAAEPLSEPMPEVAPPVETAARPANIVSVLPPLSTAPANSSQRALRPEQNMAYLIMGTPGMSAITRSFAAQILGQYREEAGLTAQQLSPTDLKEYRINKALQRLTPEGE